MRKTCLALALCLTPMAVPAADADTQALIDELRVLSDKAREQRAADRWLQRALDDLVARHDWPWRKELVVDDFSDGDYQNNPGWQVLDGRFWVSRGRGLRSRIEAGRAADGNGGQPPSMEEAVIGALLQQAFGTGDREQHQTEPAPAVTSAANAIRLDAAITNAFAVDTEFSLETPDGTGRFALALLQGDTGRYGYRLRVQTGPDGFIELERVRAGRGAIVEHAKLTEDPGDGARHRLAWRQAVNGQVTVELDGQALIGVRDKAFRDGYQQLVLTHNAGDLSLHSVRISGTD